MNFSLVSDLLSQYVSNNKEEFKFNQEKFNRSKKKIREKQGYDSGVSGNNKDEDILYSDRSSGGSILDETELLNDQGVTQYEQQNESF